MTATLEHTRYLFSIYPPLPILAKLGLTKFFVAHSAIYEENAKTIISIMASFVDGMWMLLLIRLSICHVSHCFTRYEMANGRC